ncbi:uncharacterized protein PHACADRAFT_198821 [Phanerochaete carnosa HHB-10118-sp]|uniref:Uncharacterized protein n=1 Tax=Phanerochaete carnosa (strain HHB-10118-sp) TaxID=650164 RepID=K5WQX8_PHACS|nr:uncharacterized protein PHACADRAFT_198821 [Phanerochaete carnosa HHB-10118-sp]EKM52772.1 hypothetical protein PHACADRAFT_198821 [Phanerochaete carnosa HHB-10118-sp]
MAEKEDFPMGGEQEHDQSRYGRTTGCPDTDKQSVNKASVASDSRKCRRGQDPDSDLHWVCDLQTGVIQHPVGCAQCDDFMHHQQLGRADPSFCEAAAAQLSHMHGANNPPRISQEAVDLENVLCHHKIPLPTSQAHPLPVSSSQTPANQAPLVTPLGAPEPPLDHACSYVPQAMELNYGNSESSLSAKGDDAQQGPAAEKWPARKFGSYPTKTGRPTIEGSGYSADEFNKFNPKPTESELEDATPAQKNLWQACNLKQRKRNEQRAAVSTKPLAITPWEQSMNHAKYALNVIKRYKGEYSAIRNPLHWNNHKGRNWMRWGYYANHHIKYLDKQRKLHKYCGVPAGISIPP